MKLSEMFPDKGGKWLRAADLNKKPLTVTIKSMDSVEVDDDGERITKYVLHFEGDVPGLVLNKTNTKAIAYLYGDDNIPDGWVGNKIELYPTLVDFQGKDVEAIRVRMPSRDIGETF